MYREYAVPDDWTRTRVRKALAERLNIRAEGTERASVFYDTFDWRLHRAGWTLEYVPGNPPLARLVRLADGRAEEQRLDDEPPRFLGDWPRGAVKTLAAPLTEVRALLPLVRLGGSADRYAVLNRDGKTVCRLAVEHWRVDKAAGGREASFKRVRVSPLRGWHEEAASVAAALSDTGLPAASMATLDTALALLGRQVRDYSQKFRLPLSPRLDAARAARAILSRLFDDMLRNEEGTRRDIDPEFLHDYRVAVRRTRSALTVFRAVFGAEAIAEHEASFRRLGRLTGDKRNLDVHLIDFDGHLDGLDDEQRTAMAGLRQVLEHRCREAGAELAACLKGDEYRAFKRDYRRFLKDTEAAGDAAAMSVKEFADQALWKACRRIERDGRRIRDRSPDEALHDLRKRGKQFRYLMEFFLSLYPAKRMKTAITELKQLQDLLGLFQDQCVQVETLEELRNGDVDEVAGSAIEQLVDGLQRARAESRAAFRDHFARFDTKANRARYAALFKPGGKC